MEVLDGHWTESTGHWHESTEHKRESTGLESIWKPEQKVDPVPGLSTYNCQKSTDDGLKRVQQFAEVQIKLWLDRVQCCLYQDSNHKNTCACATDNDCIHERYHHHSDQNHHKCWVGYNNAYHAIMFTQLCLPGRKRYCLQSNVCTIMFSRQ